MGCDIHTWIEVRTDGVWKEAKVDFSDLHTTENEQRWKIKKIFDWRSYGMFGFLADVRNYSLVPGFKAKGRPPEHSIEVGQSMQDDDYHSWSYLTAAELNAFDYDQEFWDRRTGDSLRGVYAKDGEGRHLTIREFLGPLFFTHIQRLTSLADDPNNVRVVFAFDN